MERTRTTYRHRHTSFKRETHVVFDIGGRSVTASRLLLENMLCVSGIKGLKVLFGMVLDDGDAKCSHYEEIEKKDVGRMSGRIGYCRL